MPQQAPGDSGPDPDDGSRAETTGAAARNLWLRIGSAVVLAGLFLLAAFLDPRVLLAFCVVAVVIAMLELDAALRSVALRPPTAIVLVGGIGMFVGAYLTGARGQLLALAGTFFGVLLWALTDSDDSRPLRSSGAALLIALWVPFLGSFLALLLARDGGEWFLVVIVALTAASDIAAFGVGSRLGRHKLAPAISPGKTWEGFAGGVVATTVVAVVVAPLVIDDLSLGLAVALGALISLVATVGDLAESAVKRSLGVKDLGTLLPGHGGMMDRIDALLFTLPVAHLVLLAGGL